jgi:hypothetical protein
MKRVKIIQKQLIGQILLWKEMVNGNVLLQVVVAIFKIYKNLRVLMKVKPTQYNIE